MTTTPDGLIEGAEAAASAWRLDRSRLVEAEEKILALKGWQEALEQDLAAAVARGDGLAADLESKAAQLAEALEQVAALQATVEELRAKLAECEGHQEPPPPPPPPVEWEPLDLVMHGEQAPEEGVMVTVATVLPQSFAAQHLLVAHGEQHVTVDPQQVDILNRWPDGSARHVLVTVPYLAEGGYALGPSLPRDRPLLAPQIPRDLNVQLRVPLADGTPDWRVVLPPTDPSAYEVRISGPALWEGRARVRVEPRLEVIFDIRCYRGGQWSADVILGNLDFKVATAITYDLTVRAGAEVVYSREAIAQWHHSKVMVEVDPWGAQGVAAKCPAGKWADWGLLPRYAGQVSAEGLADLAKQLAVAEANLDPMSSGIVNRVMGAVGGRGDIGPQPRWVVQAVLSGDPGAYRAMFHCADRSTPFPVHYYDYTNAEPYSIIRHPTGTTINVNDGVRPEDAIAVSPSVNLRPDNAHTPSLCYVPWMLTGRRIWLDELEDWVSWKNLGQNHKYRGGSFGLLKAREEARAQAWNLRDLLTLWLALPDSRMARREELRAQLDRNAAWYRDVAAKTNPLGRWGLSTYSLAEFDKTKVKAHDRAWQNDFLIMVVGWCVKAGLEEWRESARWFASYVVGRFDNLTPQQASAYHLAATRPDGLAGFRSETSDWITDWAEIAALSPDGSQSWEPSWSNHYQVQACAALATAADLGIPGARELHSWLWGLTVEAFPDRYGAEPTFVIAPDAQA